MTEEIEARGRAAGLNPAIMALWLRATEHPYGLAIPCGSEQDRFTLVYQLKRNRDEAKDPKYQDYVLLMPEGSNEVWIVLKLPEPEAVEDDPGDE